MKLDNRATQILFVAFYWVLANVPYWAASHWFGFLRDGWFALEYAGVGIVALFVPRLLAASLLLMAVVLDIAGGICRTFYLSPSGCVTNLGALSQLPFWRLLGVISVFTIALLAALAASQFRTAAFGRTLRWRAAAYLFVLAAAFSGAQCALVVRAAGHLPDSLRTEREISADGRDYSSLTRFVRLRTLSLIQVEASEAWGGRRRELGLRKPLASTPGAAQFAMLSADPKAIGKVQDRPNVVLILVESWGSAKDSAIDSALSRPYLETNMLARYKVSLGKVKFNGATLDGEARELCGTDLGYHILDASREELQACLPMQLAALGYRDIALHGMKGEIYDRLNWYREIGFQERWFKSEFQRQGLPNCNGAFVGVCDAAIAEWIGRRLASPSAQPEFVYWMTLNSHLPAPVPSPLPDGADCLWNPLLRDQPEVCSWYQLVANVHRSVTKIALGALDRPTVFVVVGDHAPPFSNPETRNRFSATEVPFVVLTPRAENLSASSHTGRDRSIP